MQNLGGLGTEEGPRLAYTWVPASVLPQLLPWLALLLLLTLKPNRTFRAWWLWVAVFCGFGLQSLLVVAAPFLSSDPRDLLMQTLTALNFGMAAAWLLAGFLGWKHRFITFLAMFGIMFGVALGTFLVSQAGGGGSEALVGGVVVLICVFVISAALSLAGLLTRKRYHPWRLTAWCTVMVTVLTSLVMTPFFISAMLASPGVSIRKEFFQVLGLMTGINLGTLLVYLVLGFATNFYRERLKALLHLGTHELPPVIAPAPALEPAGVRQD